MKKITAIVIAYNEIENVKNVIESFRLFGNADLSVILVDNGSDDGLEAWAKEQTDLTYVLLDEGHMGCGKALNMVRKELEIDTDLLIIEGHYLLTPGYLSRLSELLDREEDIGAVSGVGNSARFHQNLPRDILDYRGALEAAGTEKEISGRRTMMLHHGATLWKKSALDKLGEFEETVEGMPAVMNDYCLRAVMADEKLLVCPEAFFWNLKAYDSISIYEEAFEKEWEKKVLEKKWGMHYFNGSYNEKLIRPIDAGKEEEIYVLEVGCDCGGTLVEIKNRYPNAKVYGSEINEKAAEIAGHFAQVTVNNIENKDLTFPKETFHYIIFGDVLEHLHDPLETLIYCRDFLRKDGCIIASIPNLMHISVMEELLQGDFTYTETGLLDKTHIHFFTYNEIVRMFCKAGYTICEGVTTVLSISKKQQELIDKLLSLGCGAERFMYEAFQYNIKARLK